MLNRHFVPALVLTTLMAGVFTSAPAQRRPAARDWEVSCSRARSHQDDRERACNLIEKTVAAPSGRLTVDSRMNGGIIVVGENRRDVLVRAMVEAHSRTRAQAEDLIEEVELQIEGSRVSADGPDTGRNEWWSVTFEVHVPASSDLDLAAHNGGIAVAGVTGTLRMQTLNGGVHLDGVNGDVRAETTNGGLHIDLDGDRWEGRGLDATTTNGGVELTVPAGYSAHLETGTTNGGMDIDFPVMVQGRIGRRITTDLGRGGATIRLITTNGGVAVKRR